MEEVVLVIGAGVIGLSVAVRLAEEGRSVRVIAERLPAATTSAMAGASWGPYLVEEPRILKWCENTRAELEKIAEDSESGVRRVRGVEAAKEVTAAPDWARNVVDWQPCRAEELPEGYLSGWRYTIPLIDMPTYLRYLTRRLEKAGVVIQQGSFGSLAEATALAPVVINCSGLGAQNLVPDESVYPSRGQTVVVTNPGIDEFFQDTVEGRDLTYIFPHGEHCVLGGNLIDGATDVEPDEAETEAIMARCIAVQPRLADAKIINARVGLRPARETVRVDREDLDGRVVVHNYGHGGAGVTLSWGCADEVLMLVGAGVTAR